MKLGFATAILPDLSLEEVAQFASETGYECIEVMCWPPSKADRRYAGITHIDVTDFDAVAAAKVQDLGFIIDAAFGHHNVVQIGAGLEKIVPGAIVEYRAWI